MTQEVATKTTQKNILGYARVSTPKQELDVQKDMIINFCRKNELTLIDILEDKLTGQRDDRPSWQRVMTAVREKKIDGVVFVRADRVARSVKNLLSIVEEFQKAKVELISITEPIYRDISSPQGKLIITVMGAISEFESSLIRDRMTEGRERAKIVGTKSGKEMHRPFIEINWKRYDELKALDVPMRSIAKQLGVSHSKLYDALKDRKSDGELPM